MVNKDSEVSAGMKMLRQMSHFTIKNRVSAWDLKQVGENDGVPGLTAMRFITNASQSGQHPAAQSLKDKKHNAEKVITWVEWILILQDIHPYPGSSPFTHFQLLFAMIIFPEK
jgi:hypothetical protein